MLRKIDIGVDKNLFVVDPKAAKKPALKFLEDDIPKNPEETLTEARKISAPLWLNSDPLLIAHTDETGQAYLFFITDDLRKKVILLNIWDYTLLPCRRSLAHIQEWNKHYGLSGLLTIGVHSPMFEFGKDRKLVQDSLRELGITYPVVLDNDFHIWRSLENRYWPRRLLMDSSGKFHQDVVGEGQYEETELAIQVLLREISPGLPFPPITKPRLKIDTPDYSIPTTTPEIFLGSTHQPRFGNPTPIKMDNEEVVFKDTMRGNYQLDLTYLDGAWLTGPESLYGAPTKGDLKLSVKFSGTDVYLVARCKPKNPLDQPQGTKVAVMIDRKPLPFENMGSAVQLNEVRKTVVIARDPKLYHVVKGLDHGIHELTLAIDDDPLHTIELYAVFFEHRA